MSVIQLKEFHGMIPRLPAYALPEGHAQYALDCKPGHNELRPMYAPGQVAGPMNTQAKGIYSEDGKSFYTWPYDVFSARGPVPSDVHKRMYWTIAEPGMAPGFHTWDTTGMAISGGSPFGATWVGCPPPTVAPQVLPNISTPPPGVTSWVMAINLWYEKNGNRYQFTQVPIGTTSPVLGAPPSFTGGQSAPYFSCDVDNIPARSSTPVTSGGNLIVAAEAVYTNEPGPEGTTGKTYQIGVTVTGTIQINSATQVTVQTVGVPNNVFVGQVISGVTSFTDANGVLQDMAQFVGNAQANSGTPADANLVFEMIVTDTTNGISSLLLDLVTPNSITLSSSFVADANTSGATDTPSLVASALPNIIRPYNSYALTTQWPIFETRAYIYTNVNDWDEESDASPPSIISVTFAQQVSANFTVSPPSNYRPINRVRFYRTLTTDQGQTNYQFVNEMRVSNFGSYTFVDSVQSSKLQEVIPSIGWSVPPQNLQCITAMPNGIMAAFTGNTLYFCDPYHPFAWPEDYIITLPYDIIGMVAHGNGLLVTTKGYPYMVYGVHPEGMSTQKLPILQAGLSARGIVDMGTAVAYVCRDGICVVQGGIGTMQFSSSLFTRKDWRDKYDSHGYSLAQMKLAVYDGAIIAIFPAQNGFIIKLDEEAGFYCESSTMADAAYLLPQTDLYYLGIGNVIYAYGESATPLILTWQSKDVVLPRPSNFGVVQVIADQVPNLSFQTGIEIQVYGDGNLIFDQTIVLTGPSQNIIRRLPSGQKFRRYSVKVNGIGYIKELFLASVPSELQNA